jgi:hypothetical protein
MRLRGALAAILANANFESGGLLSELFHMSNQSNGDRGTSAQKKAPGFLGQGLDKNLGCGGAQPMSLRQSFQHGCDFRSYPGCRLSLPAAIF